MALKYLKVFGLLAVAILVTYFSSPIISSIFFIATFLWYLNDKDEAVWLTFYFVISDGFMGFFNNYEAVVSIIPGLPPVEVGHFYVIGTLIKLRRLRGPTMPVFYRGIGIAMLVYVAFLVAEGFAIGVSLDLRIIFRILKLILPLALFATLPKIMTKQEEYRTTFDLFVPFAFLALFAQVFTVGTGLAPSQALGLHQKLWFTELLEHGQTYRGFYSSGLVLVSFFGALYYLTYDPNSKMRLAYMGVLIANVLSAFISATRGWVLAFSMVLILYALLVARLNAGRLMLGVVLSIALLFGIKQIPAVDKQFKNATDRLLTIGLVAQGDVTAGGTLERLDRRAPRVMKKWEESPLTGLGFSNEYHEYNDSHVGNHNVLLHGGIIGALLMAFFLFHFCWRIVARSAELPPSSRMKSALLVIPIFFMGWFIIHSSSGQQFGFYGEPGMTIPVALFFSFGAFCHHESYSDQV